MKRALGGIALTITVLTGCSSAAPVAPQASTPDQSPSSTTEPGKASATTAAASAAPEPTRPAALKVGRTYTQPGVVRVTVLDYRARVAVTTPITKGDKWVGVRAKTCNLSDGKAAFSWGPWALADADDGRYPFLDLLGPEFPKPTYPTGQTPYNPGECTNGWIVFQIPIDAKPTEVRYAALDGSASASWSLP